ncbi:MAG: hypothetical protein R6U89_07100 [Dehalococcoidia bacterium]
MQTCYHCGRELGEEGKSIPTASISGSIMGDEYTESYFFCEGCQEYTVQIWRDRFCGEDSVSIRGHVPKEEGDRQIEIIRRCAKPWSKRCRCEAHVEYFGNWLD